MSILNSMSNYTDVPYRPHKSVNELRHQNSKGYFFAIPKGHNVSLWFTIRHNKPVCIEKNNKKVSVIQCSFNKKLCLDTVVSAVKFRHKNKWFYAIHDVLKYRGQVLTIFDISYLDVLCKSIQNVKNFIIFGVPLYNKILNNLKKNIQNLSYDIYEIQYRFKHHPYLIQKYTVDKKMFTVKPEVTQDIYSLYENNKFHSYALIPNIKTSIFMNKIFRNIKENKDIDLIEESDNEDEFENTDVKRYIKEYERKMECVYNETFKLWTPIAVV